MDTVEVTLQGYEGWTLPLILAGSMCVVWLITYLVWGKIDQSVRIRPGTEYVGMNWIVRQFYGFAVFIAAFAIIIITQGASNAWDEQQRIEALVEAGIENPTLVVNARGYKVNDWAGTQDGQYLLGYFQQLEGEKWLLVGGKV